MSEEVLAGLKQWARGRTVREVLDGLRATAVADPELIAAFLLR